jgi:hypothetical protein
MENLRLPPPTNDGYHTVVEIRLITLQRLLNMFWTLRLQTNLKTQTELITMWMQIRQTLEGPKDREQVTLLEELAKGDRNVLKIGLADPNPLFRLTAVQAIGRRRLHMEKDLLACLSDAEPLIRAAAHQALVRLARGTDFGPKPAAGKLEQSRALRSWKTWLARQDDPEATTDAAPLDPEEAEAARWAVELVQAPREKEEVVLQRLRSAPEPQGTLALAAASAEAKSPRQAKVRYVLAQRLAEQELDAVKKRLTDSDPEVRRAAAVAVGLKKAKQLIPETLKLLEDPDAGISQAARATLKLLTRRDFGPSPNANAIERSIAVGQWYRWWVKAQKAP